MARDRINFQGLPARICWAGLGQRHRLGLVFNEMVSSGELSVPIVIGRDHLDGGSVASPNRETEAMMDMGLPKIDGWEATRRIKADAETSHIPIIALTGYDVGHDREKALAAGCDEYSGKPVNFEQLQKIIESFL